MAKLKPFRKRPSNCLLFALRLYYRRKRKGRHGYVTSRESFYGWFPHFMYARFRTDMTIQLVGYVPLNPVMKMLPPPLFRGRVQWGDPIRNDHGSQA